MPRSLLVVLVATIVLVFASSLHATQVCDAALVKSTYNSFLSDQMDWRLATLVSENDYKDIKHDVGANAVIYGIPVGASYGDYQKEVTQKLSEYHESLTRNQLRNIQWTGLDANSPGAYENCLKAQVLGSRGLHIVAQTATKTDVSILVVWNPTNGDPSTITPKWTWQDAVTTPLPTSIQQGETIVVLPRPRQERTFAVNYRGFKGSLAVEPLSNIKIPSLAPLVNVTEETLSDNAASGNCANFGSRASVCSKDKPEGWTIVSAVFQLTGDRAGCAYAECQPVTQTATQVCWHFRTQGHSEECGDSGNTGIHYSQGKLTVVWAHR